ncbi:retrovirus-related pol polyprotein from transposon TNT 1-94 [Tanacetum coccineum]
MGSHTLQQLKRLSFDELKALFETTMRRVQTFHPIESEGDKTVPELTTGSSKRDAEVELDHEGSKKQKTNEASRPDLVKERFSTTEPTDDKEKELWVELKRLFEPDNDDTLWKLQRDQHKSSTVLDKKADSSTEQFLLTLMEEVKGLKKQIDIPSVTFPSATQLSSSESTKQKTWFGPCKHYSLRNHLFDDCYSKLKCSTCESTNHLTKEHIKQTAVNKTLTKLKAQSSVNPSSKKAPMIPNPFKECKYCGFSDHHSDNCKYYPGCEVCGSIAHEPADCPKKHPNSRKPRIANKRSTKPTEKYSKEPGPKVVFGDDSSGDTEGYGSVNCNGIIFTRVAYGTIFNQKDEVILINPRRRDVYVIDMSSFNKESNACFLAKSSLRVNWLWRKRLSHLNFKNINNLSKHNLVSGLPSLTFSKDKNCSACEKGKNHKASFKTKRSFFISKSLHLLHMDLFGPVKPQTINHNKYTLVIVDEYSRKMENLNKVWVKELRSNNGTKGEAVNTACFNQNRSIIVKRHGKTAYEVFRGISPDISYFHVFGCPVHIHNHRDHLGKFDEKADDGFFLGYSLVAKAFRVFNIRRQEMEETVHVTFSEDDKAISQSSTKGDEINFNENISFPDDEFLEPMSEVTQCPTNIEYFSYIPAYENSSPFVLPSLHNIVSSKEPPELTGADDHPTLNELDQVKSADNLVSAEAQDNVTNELIRDTQPSSIFSPSDGIHQSPVPQDRWSREKHIELVNIIGEPLAGITTRSRVKDSKAASANECLYVNFLSEIKPKKLIEALEEEGWVIAIQEELN